MCVPVGFISLPEIFRYMFLNGHICVMAVMIINPEGPALRR